MPEESVKVLTEVGHWMDTNGETIYKSDLCQVRRSNYASFTRTGNTLYMHVHFWPGDVCGHQRPESKGKIRPSAKDQRRSKVHPG